MKMNKKRPILRRAAIPAVLALLCTLFWFGKPNDFGPVSYTHLTLPTKLEV